MRIPIAKKYERTSSTIFSCLSIGLFLFLIQRVLFPENVIGNILGLFIIFVSSILVVRAFYFERRKEVFDLTNPTIFETGLLVFQSQQNRCAVFFTFCISSWKLKKILAQRILTILLKILPVSTIVALEWTSTRKCFINFYIKLEKSSFLTRTRELVDNIDSSFNKMLGTPYVQKLNAEELMRHFSLGIPGIIRQIQGKGKYSINVRTDVTAEKRLFSLINPVNRDTINQVFREFSSQNTRLILPIQRKDKNLQIAESFVMISDEPHNNRHYKQLQQNEISLNKIHASKLLRMFGDVLSRNMIQDEYEISDFKTAVDFILNVVPRDHQSELEREPPFERKPTIPSQHMDPSTWREFLIQTCSDLDLSCAINPLIHIDKIPIRFDAKICDKVFFIVSHTNDQHLRWLVNTWTKPHETTEQKEIVLLISEDSQRTIIEEMTSPTSRSYHISIISTKKDLKNQLEELKNRILTGGEAVVQVT
ncbi:MAG: hypothetical protein ACFFAL_10795 [Promethearchaeota archaeon]